MNFTGKYYIITVIGLFLLINLALVIFNITAQSAGRLNPEYVYNHSEIPEKTFYTYYAYPARKIISPDINI